jgi:hypothetical protein
MTDAGCPAGSLRQGASAIDRSRRRVWLSFVPLFAAVLLLAISLAPVSAVQTVRFARGQSVFVVAVKTTGRSAVFVTCGPSGPPVPPMRSSQELVPAGIELLPGGLPAPALRTEVERLFTKYGRFKPVSSADQADLVFVIQVREVAISTSSHSSRSSAGPAGVITVGSPDVPIASRPTPTLLLAVAVPAESWRAEAHDADTLLTRRVWEGVERSVNGKAGSPASLLEAVSKHPEWPYAQKIESGRPEPFAGLPPEPGSILNDRQQPAPRPEPRPSASPFPPATICAAPLTPHAPNPHPASAQPVAPGPATPTAAGANAPPPPPAPPTFSTNVVAVEVPILATGSNSTPATGLAASDFRVYQDGTEQPVAGLLTEAEPLSVAVLLDTSLSIRARFENTRAAAAGFLDQLRPADAVMVASFGDGTFVGCEFTRDRAVARDALLRMRAGGSITRLHDAIDVLITERLGRYLGARWSSC